jgi:hypothetical protein
MDGKTEGRPDGQILARISKSLIRFRYTV